VSRPAEANGTAVSVVIAAASAILALIFSSLLSLDNHQQD
jgi:hypothetical protein